MSIPANTNVVSVTTGFWVPKHSGKNDGSAPGLPSPTNPNMKYYAANSSRTARGALASTGSQPSSGYFWNFRDNIAVDAGAAVGPALPFRFLGEASKTWADGSSSIGWGIETTWTPGDVRPASITTSGDCKNFRIDSMGGIEWVAQKTYILDRDDNLPNWRFWKIILDDGSVIEGQDSRSWVGDSNYH